MMVNHSLNGETRINVDVGIAYKENIARARDVLLSAINAVPGVLDTPAADVVVRSLGDSSINLQVRGWIADSSRERSTRFAMTEACKVALDEAGIEIPFPHLQLFVENVSDQALRGLATLTPRAS
jgi:small-conductance mechanosensitive channel